MHNTCYHIEVTPNIMYIKNGLDSKVRFQNIWWICFAKQSQDCSFAKEQISWMPTQNTTTTPINKSRLNHLINPRPHQWIRNHLLFSSGSPVLCSKAGTRAGSSQASWRQANRVKSELIWISQKEEKRQVQRGFCHELDNLGSQQKTQDQHRGEHHAHLQPKTQRKEFSQKQALGRRLRRRRRRKRRRRTTTTTARATARARMPSTCLWPLCSQV